MAKFNFPYIKTALPGPKSKKLIKKDEKYVSQSYTRAYPTVIERGEGALFWDVDGNCFIDFHSGIGVCTTGNCHPSVVKAIKKQVEMTIHVASADFYHEPVGKLAKVLNDIVPGKGAKRTFFTNSGTEAVEAAMKLARYNKKCPGYIAFIGGFHGRTMGSLSLTCSKDIQRKHFAPFIPEVTHVPYAYCYRCPYHLKYPSCNFYCVEIIEEFYLSHVCPPENVAAMVIEPIQGEGGYIIPPPGYHNRLKKLCEKYDILYVADEVQSGMGKTGKMFALEHWGVMPDIIAVAKGIASGMPLGACIASAKLMSWEPGAHSTTFGGSPVSCVAALETIKLLKNGLMENARKVGNYLLTELKKIQNRHYIIGDVRGKGLMIGIEFVRDKKTKEPAPELSDKVQKLCFKTGLMLLTCGPNVIRFVPPLVITKDIASRALEIFDAAVNKVEAKRKR